MTANFPGPFELRINYISNEPSTINEHQLRLSFECGLTGDPGDPFDAWHPITKGGSSALGLDSHVTALMAAIEDNWSNTTDFLDAELWEYDVGTYDAIFRSTEAIGTSGGSGSGTQSMSQSIWTFRAALGGIMKVDFRATIHAPGTKVSLPSTGIVQSTADYFLDDDSPWWARDNSHPIAALKFLPGQNERAFRKLNR